MSTKFEQLLDLLVNEEMDKANELFHEIVVEKSREIYENLIAEEAEEDMDEAADEEADESVDEGAEEEDEEMDESAESDEEMDESADEEADESVDLEDSYMMDGEDDDAAMGGDATDKSLGDVEVGAGDEEDPEASEDDAIMSIKSAIQELEAAFAELQQAQGSEEPHGDFGDDDADAGSDDMMGFQEGRRMTREYVEKVSDGHGAEKKGAGEGGIAGANTGEKMPTGTNTKSPVSSGKGKPTTGATAANILGDSSTGAGTNVGTTPAGKVGGVVKQGGKFTSSGTHNVDGVKSGIKTVTKQGAGYPGNNKSAGPVGSGTGDKAGQTSVSSDKPFLKKL